MKFARLKPLLGEEALVKLSKATVAIIGLGGVGGIAAETLARSGVGHLVICDFDAVEESNINRQIVANTKTIGQNKALLLAKMIEEINPDCSLTVISQPYYNFLKVYNIKYLIDAIDDVKSKIALIKDCLDAQIIFISAMGAGNKLNPNLVNITTLNKTTYDPLARILRQEFKKQTINVVSSVEEVGNNKFSQVNSYMPTMATFGLLCADFIIKEIIRS